MSNTLLLIRAASDGDAEAVTSLLAQGTLVNGSNESRQTPLIRAVIAGEVDIVRLLLAAGADVRVKDDFGLTAIEWSERRGFSEITQLIAGASPADAVPPPKNPTPEQDPPKVDRRRMVIEPKIAPDHDAQIWFQEPKMTEVEESARPFAADFEIAKEQSDRRWIEDQKRIIAEAKRLEEEDARRQSTTEESLPPVQDAAIWKEQQQRLVAEYERRTGEKPRQTAEELARIKARMESDRVSEEARKRIEEEVQEKTRREPLSSGYKELPTGTARFEPQRNGPSNLKRCPKCNATYDSDLLKYCARDATQLINASDPLFSLSAAQSSARPTVWILVAITLMASALVTYLATNYLSNDEGFRVPLAAQGKQAMSAERNLPLLDGVLSGKEISLPEPEYPANAKSEGIAGTVRVAIRVNKKGIVTSARALDGDQRLRPAAIRAARSATFSSEKLAGRGAGGTITYTFKL